MPTAQVQTPPVATAEPISLAQLAAWLRLDLPTGLLAAYVAGADLGAYDPQQVADLDNLNLHRVAAREAVEAYTLRYFAPQTLALTYELGEPYLLPAGATATAVTGFFTDLDQLAGLDSYLVDYEKGISVNRTLPLQEALRQTYTVTVEVVADVQYLHLAKSAMLELAAEWFRNRETSADTTVSVLPVSYKVKLAPARLSVAGEAVWG